MAKKMQPEVNDNSIFLPRRKMLSAMASGVILPVMGIALTSCQSQEIALPSLTKPGNRLNLGVAAIDIIIDYKTPNDPIYIDDSFTPSPATQLSNWAEDKLVPMDDQGNLLLTITMASMTERDIQSEESLKSLFTNEQRLLVEVTFEAIFSFSHPNQNRSATLTIASEAQSSISDNTSPATADEIRLRVVREAIGRLDQEFRRQVRNVSDQAWPLM